MSLRSFESLETEIKKFASDRTYWVKYLAGKILNEDSISQEDFEVAFSYLLEELKLIPSTNKNEITIAYNENKSTSYNLDLILKRVENVEGVNALKENQIIEFSPHLTIIYGINGSGKSGYVRLFKKAFYSKSSEEIVPNIHLRVGHKSTKARFVFESQGKELPLVFPENRLNSEFGQYAVFDVKSVIAHLDHRNEFEFRPAALGFFSRLTEAIKNIEQRLNAEIDIRKSENNFALWFDGDSEIKNIILNLSSKSNLEELKKHTPFLESDKLAKENIEKQYDELHLASKGKEKEISALENLRKILIQNKENIQRLNSHFSVSKLTGVQSAISDYLLKEELVRHEGAESFKSDKILKTGTSEWKNFIVAAETFAIKQQSEMTYPQDGDSCLLCHQPLSKNARELIEKYWAFIKSIAEENFRKAREIVDKVGANFKKIDFNLFADENILTVWLGEKHPGILKSLKEVISQQEKLKEDILIDIDLKRIATREEITIDLSNHDTIEVQINNFIKALNENEYFTELDRLLKEKTRLTHKEKLNVHFQKIELYINNQLWIVKANKANFGKRLITDTEKSLSDKYFNQKYIDTFNKECKTLDGHFGIEINHTGSAGKSYRQLKLKGRNPNTVLSEGEQKVIAIADFLSEMQMSEINRGIIFDDPVTSLDDTRKSQIANRLIEEASAKQVIIFTHDLVFVSSLVSACEEANLGFDCHWIENLDNIPGTIWLKNTPSFEKSYKKSGKAQEYYVEAKKVGPELRESILKNGFAALRTSYESLVVFDLFNGVVQRFNERVSVDSLPNVFFDLEIRDELLDSFHQCCRYMEGHSHSDKYAYKKPELENLNEEIQRFNQLKGKIKTAKEGNQQ